MFGLDMKKTITALCLLGISLTAWASLNSGANIDWPRGRIHASTAAPLLVAAGKPLDSWDEGRISINAARMQAYERAREQSRKKIIDLLMTIRVDPENTMKDLVEKNEETRKGLSLIVERGITFRDHPRGFYHSGCEGILPLGDLLEALPFSFPGEDFPTRMDNPIDTEYTSLIIDTRGLGVKPMLLPSIYSTAGLEIYGKNFIDASYAARHGMASFAYTDTEAMTNKRAGKHPYYTAALKSIRHCPVLSERDARKILASPKTREHLKKCRVIFIIDREG
jgi:hypothetical protein